VTEGGSGPVCLYAINVARGSNVLLGCSDVPFYTGSPVGSLDSVKVASGSVTVSGWAIDPDTSASITVHAYVDGVGRVLTADRERADLAPHYPVHGTRHGFSATLSVPLDAKTICLYGVDSGADPNTTLGCRNIMIPAARDIGRAPIGDLESVQVQGTTARATGWAIDPDTLDPIPVHLYVGATGRSVLASGQRADVAAAYPAYGDKHGFAATVDVPTGVNALCAYAINTAGENTTLGCRTVEGADGGRAPIGAVDSATVSGTTATVTGWAIDPDTTRPIAVRISVDGKATETRADVARDDIGAAYPLYGTAHGYSQTVAIPIGPSRICVTAVNTSGPDTSLGCRSVATRDEGRAPIGSLDDVTVNGTNASVRGWTIDPDTARPIDVHVYVGSVGTVVTAGSDRPDVGAAYPLYGAAHGFQTTVKIPLGLSRLCVYGINTVGANTTLGCRDVRGAAPRG
jgi:hypothetical protein